MFVYILKCVMIFIAIFNHFHRKIWLVISHKNKEQIQPIPLKLPKIYKK